MLKRRYERTGSEAMDGDAFPRRALAGCVPSPPFPSWASLLHPSAPSFVGEGARWGQAARSSGPTGLLAASWWFCRGVEKGFQHRFIPDSVCRYDVSGVGSGGYVAMENTCAFYSQIERKVHFQKLFSNVAAIT